MKTKILTPVAYDMIRNAKRPEQTSSYMPVTHAELIDYVREKFDKEGINIVNERYSTAKGGNQMFGEMALQMGDSDLRWSMGFRNSHDKSLPIGFVAGAQVIVCSNLMLRGDVKQVRKHTINVNRDLDEKFELIKENIEGNFKKIQNDIAKYKDRGLSFEKEAELYGKILLRDTKVANSNQVSAAMKLFKEPIHDFGNDTVWGFYNTFTEAFKEAHPTIAPQNYLKLHEFVNQEFNLN